MRITKIAQDVVEFDSGCSVEAPVLLALPICALALVSLFHEPVCSRERVTGSALLLIAALACTLRESPRRRLKLRPNSRKLIAHHKVISIAPDAYLELDRCDPLNSDYGSVPYELRILDGMGLRQVLVRSKLVPLLNDLRHLLEIWQIRVTLGSSIPNTFYEVLAEKSEFAIGDWGSVRVMSPARQNQYGIAGILVGISLFALTVIFFLATDQLSRLGQVSALGCSLGALLVLAPLVIAIHIALGRVQVHIEGSFLRVEFRRGVLGKKTITIPRDELKGAWWIQSEDKTCNELLILQGDAFCSIAMFGSARSHCRAECA